MNTIEVNTYQPVIAGTTEIKLPHYYICGSFGQNYCCISEDMILTQVWSNGNSKQVDVRKYDDLKQVKSRMELDMRDRLYEPIDEAVFHHKFSEAHREIFYAVNPNLRPKA